MLLSLLKITEVPSLAISIVEAMLVTELSPDARATIFLNFNLINLITL